MRVDDFAQLVRLALRGEREHFENLVRAVAANEGGLAKQRILAALDTKRVQTASMVAWEAPSELTKFATVLEPSRPPRLYLEPSTTAALQEVLDEHTHGAALQAAGLAPTVRILLWGPPGTGKTSTAAWLAASLGRRLAVVRLRDVVGSHLGETGANMGRLFQAISKFVGVVFLDEVDAVGTTRADGGHAADRENARIVNDLLTLVEGDIGDNLVVAATNRRDLLDAALLRRFDAAIEYHLPGASTTARMVADLGSRLDARTQAGILQAALAEAWCHARIASEVLRARKRQVLDRFRRPE